MRLAAVLATAARIDDDPLGATPLVCEFDLVCTAERARGYKPDGTLLRLFRSRIGAFCLAGPALRAIAVHRHGGRQAARPYRRLDQSSWSRPGPERTTSRCGSFRVCNSSAPSFRVRPGDLSAESWTKGVCAPTYRHRHGLGVCGEVESAHVSSDCTIYQPARPSFVSLAFLRWPAAALVKTAS